MYDYQQIIYDPSMTTNNQFFLINLPDHFIEKVSLSDSRSSLFDPQENLKMQCLLQTWPLKRSIYPTKVFMLSEASLYL